MAGTRAVIRPTIRVAEEYGEALDDLAVGLREAGFDADVRTDAEEKFLDPQLTDLALQLLGALQDHVVDAAAGALLTWAVGLRGKRQDPEPPPGAPGPPRKARILGPNGEILREVDLEEHEGDS